MTSEFRPWASRLLSPFTRRRSEADLGEEIQAHLDRLAVDHVGRGLSPAEARAAARREFGGVDQVKETYRDQRGLPLVDTLSQDVRYTLRTLYHHSGFTSAAVITLALGIGANAALFSLIDPVLLRPLPFRDAGRLVMLWERSPDSARETVAPLNFLDWTAQSHSFASMAAVAPDFATVSDADGNAERFPAQLVTPSFFDVLEVKAIAGRTFVQDDGESRTGIIVSERVWKTRYGADPKFVGQSITIGVRSWIVIGIVPANSEIIGESDFWRPYAMQGVRESRRRGRSSPTQVIARLKPGVTIKAAQADMTLVADNIALVAPDTNKGVGVFVEPLQRAVVGDELHTTTLVLGGVVAFVLLLACANVANLLLARGVGRTREIAVRAALGGSRRRIVRQLLTESLVLASLGGAIGLALAWVAVRVAPSFIPSATLPVGVRLGFDARLAAFSIILTCLTALVFGLAPALQAASGPLAEAMGAGARAATPQTGFLRNALTVVEVAAALLLATGAGLLLRTVVSLDGVAAGYRADNVLTMSVTLPGGRYPTPESRRVALQAIEDEVSRVPGVNVAALSTDVPLDGRTLTQGFEVVGDAPLDPVLRPVAHLQVVSPRYFEALGISILHGRAFSVRDTGNGAQVCIVNEEFARRYFQGRDPIGLRVSVPDTTFLSQPAVREVVGVSRQVSERPNASERQVEIYVPVAQNPFPLTAIVVRTAASPRTLLPAIKAAVGRVQKALVLIRIRTMDDVASESTARHRFRAGLVGAFAALALALAAVGIFSVFSFTVQQRMREFSIRMALGARSIDVLRLVLGDGLKVIALGVTLGVAASFALVRSMATLLFGVTPVDPITFAGASALLAVTALAACALPALRAARSDPAVALRQE
jgi:putative ABC transport system permease protein